MKKLFALLLALVMSLSLVACGGEDADVSADGPTDAQLEELTEAYNEVATLYNDVATAINENGWMADEIVSETIKTIGAVMEPVGTALTGDMSMLDGADFDALPDALRGFIPQLEELAEVVYEPYDGDDAGVVTDEALIPVANALNEVVVVYNEVYATAEANGWLDDELTAAELQTVKGTLTYVQSALTDDPSKLEGVTDYDALAEQILELGTMLEQVRERVSVPYASEG